MSNYKLVKYPQDKYRFRVFDNARRLQTTNEVLAAHPGAVGAINLGYFAFADFSNQCAVMVGGRWISPLTYPWPGICIDTDGHMTIGDGTTAVYDYIASVQADYIDGKRTNTTAWSRNGVTYTGFMSDGTVVAMVCSKDSGLTSAEAVQIMRDAGCVTVLRWDGSWSSQGQLLPGMVVKPSQHRAVRTWLIIYPREGQKEEDKPVDSNKITKMYTTLNPCYTKQYKRDKHEGMLHSTATPGAMVQAMFAAWNKVNADAAVEFVIDDTGIYQFLPLGIRSGHCAASGNDTHIACEICEPEETIFLPINWRPIYKGGKYNKPYAVKRLQQELVALGFDPKGVDGNYGPGCTAAVAAYQRSVGLSADGSVGPTTLKYLQKREGSYLRYNAALADAYFKKVYGYAVELFAWLHGEIGLEAGKIVCHSEGFKLGIASNHADVLHWFPQHGKTMDTFRADVAAAIAGNTSPTDPLGEAVEKLITKGVILAGNADYWKGGNYSAANVQALIVKMAAAI